MPKKADLRVLGLGDDKLMERLQEAAKAAGVKTVEQLVDLVVDSGISARPPKDGLTERFTLEDLGLRLWTVALSKTPSARAEWFAGLVPSQKAAVVSTLRHRGYSALTISNSFKITEMAIEKIWAENRTSLGAQVLGVRLDTLVGGMTAAKQRAQEGAAEKKDWATFWRVEDAWMNRLQDLGIVQRAAHRVEVVDKAADVKAAALSRLVSLAEKKAIRSEELKRVDAEVIEELPADVEKGYQELKDAD